MKAAQNGEGLNRTPFLSVSDSLTMYYHCHPLNDWLHCWTKINCLKSYHVSSPFLPPFFLTILSNAPCSSLFSTSFHPPIFGFHSKQKHCFFKTVLLFVCLQTPFFLCFHSNRRILFRHRLSTTTILAVDFNFRSFFIIPPRVSSDSIANGFLLKLVKKGISHSKPCIHSYNLFHCILLPRRSNVVRWMIILQCFIQPKCSTACSHHFNRLRFRFREVMYFMHSSPIAVCHQVKMCWWWLVISLVLSDEFFKHQENKETKRTEKPEKGKDVIWWFALKSEKPAEWDNSVDELFGFSMSFLSRTRRRKGYEESCGVVWTGSVRGMVNLAVCFKFGDGVFTRQEESNWITRTCLIVGVWACDVQSWFMLLERWRSFTWSKKNSWFV